MNIINLIISLICGIIGGNVAGAAMKEKSLGPVWNSIAGILGGGLGGIILQLLGVSTEPGVDIGSILSNLVGGGVGGAILMIIIAFIKNAMQKKS